MIYLATVIQQNSQKFVFNLFDAEGILVHTSTNEAILDVVLSLLGILAVKRILLGDQVVDAAAQAPNVNFIVEICAFLYNFRSGVIQMA